VLLDERELGDQLLAITAAAERELGEAHRKRAGRMTAIEAVAAPSALAAGC